MNDNLFKTAIFQGETGLFFRGHGTYFCRNFETGEHSFGTHLRGWVVSFIQADPLGGKIFLTEFASFLESLDPSSEDDLFALISNIHFLALINKEGILAECGALKCDHPAYVRAITSYLRKVKTSIIHPSISNLVSILELGLNPELAMSIKQALQIK